MSPEYERPRSKSITVTSKQPSAATGYTVTSKQQSLPSAATGYTVASKQQNIPSSAEAAAGYTGGSKQI